jgi:hypothetical protein
MITGHGGRNLIMRPDPWLIERSILSGQFVI